MPSLDGPNLPSDSHNLCPALSQCRKPFVVLAINRAGPLSVFQSFFIVKNVVLSISLSDIGLG